MSNNRVIWCQRKIIETCSLHKFLARVSPAQVLNLLNFSNKFLQTCVDVKIIIAQISYTFILILERKYIWNITIVQLFLVTKVYHKSKVGTWRFQEALKKLMHNNTNSIFIVISLIFYSFLCASLSIYAI